MFLPTSCGQFACCHVDGNNIRVVARVGVALFCLSNNTKVPERQLACQRGDKHVLNALLSLTKCVLGKKTALCVSECAHGE